MAVVLIKVFSLGVKTLAKPLAKRFEEYVVGHPEFRATVLRVVQAYHRWEVGRTLNHENGNGDKRVFVGQMADDKALKLASTVVSEGFLFAVGTALIYLEYDRGKQKDVVKQEREKEFRQQVLSMQSALQEQVAVTRCSIDALEARLAAMESMAADADRTRRRGGWFGMFAAGGA